MENIQQDSGQPCCGRWRSARAFIAIGTGAILFGGLVAAAVAHDPSRHLVWMVAYLVLVAGLAQVAFGVGQAMLANRALPRSLIAAQVLLFNLGNAGVIIGTVTEMFIPVAGGTVLLLLGLGLFFYASRNGRGHLRHAYQALLGIIAIGALIGLTLSAVSNVT